MSRLMAVLVWCAFWGGGVSPAGAVSAPLVADLSSHQIDITTGFTGARLLLFGATEGAGDIIVVVRGPESSEVVRRKERIAGIWVNRHSVAFKNVPGFYFVAGTRPLLDIASEATLRSLHIGASRLPLHVEADVEKARAGEYRKALVRLKDESALYNSMLVPIRIIRDRLFRVEIYFPANVPTGAYTAEVHLFRHGRQVSVERKSLSVRRAGAEATIYDFAHQHSAIYGILAIVVALIAGWGAGVIFRRV